MQNTFPSSGNVDIGTTSPQAKLHVSGTVKVGAYTFISEPNAGVANVFSNNLYAGISNSTIRQVLKQRNNLITIPHAMSSFINLRVPGVPE